MLRHDGRAVLAVDERLRYGPLKAGYHGGGAPAEAVVPVAVLVPGAVPESVDDLTLRRAFVLAGALLDGLDPWDVPHIEQVIRTVAELPPSLA